MIRLTKGTLLAHIIATPEEGEPLELKGTAVVDVLVKHGMNKKEAAKTIKALLKGHLKEVLVGQPKQNA